MNDDSGMYIFTTKQDPNLLDPKIASSKTALGESADVVSAEVGLGKDRHDFQNTGKGF